MDTRMKDGGSMEGHSTREETRSRVSAMAERARDRAGDAADTARDKAESAASRQKMKATGQLESISSALRQTSGSLRDTDQGTIADYAERAAQQVDRLSEYVRTRSLGDLIDEAEQFARREPALFLGGAFLIGIAGSRFLKSSERHLPQRDEWSGERYGPVDRYEPPREVYPTPDWE